MTFHYDLEKNEFGNANEIDAVRKLDKECSTIFDDFPEYVLINYTELKNSYLMDARVGMAGGTRFLVDRLVYESLAVEIGASEEELRSLGVDKVLKLFAEMEVNPQSPEKTETKNKVVNWMKQSETSPLLPDLTQRKKLYEAYDITSDELHQGNVSANKLKDAFEDVMNFLAVYHKLGNKWEVK